MPNVPRDAERRPQAIQLTLPKHALKYKAKRLYWMLLEYEKKMAKDITSVRTADYISILDAYTGVVAELKKEGITYGYNKKARSGMVVERVDKDESVIDKTRTSKDELSRLGIGI